MYNVNLKIGDLTNKYQNICHRNILNHLCNSKKNSFIQDFSAIFSLLFLQK